MWGVWITGDALDQVTREDFSVEVTLSRHLSRGGE